MDGRPADAGLPDPLALLRERVVAAVENVDFYRDLYGPHGTPPTDPKEFMTWFSELPVVSRADFDDVPIERRSSKAYASQDLVKKQTSGSTGIPLVLYIDERVASFRSWRFRRPHFAAGETSPRTLSFIFPERFRRDRQERVMASEGVSRQTTRREKSYSTLTDALKSPELIYRDLAARKPVTLVGYASAIVRLAEWMGQRKRLPSVKRIWTTSEMLTPAGHEAIRHAFGFDAKEAYASAEFGFMGWQETDGGPFLLDTDRLVFQRAGALPGRETDADGVSRVVVSDLLNDVTPLFRYDIGDLAVMAEEAPYAPGCYQSLQELRGKVTDVIYDAGGTRIEPFAILGCLKETLGPAQYRLVCLEPSLFVLQYRPGKSPAIRLDAALKGLRKIVGAPIEVVAQKVPAIKREPSGKLRPIVNLSTMRGRGRNKLLEDLHLGEFETAGRGLAC